MYQVLVYAFFSKESCWFIVYFKLCWGQYQVWEALAVNALYYRNIQKLIDTMDGFFINFYSAASLIDFVNAVNPDFNMQNNLVVSTFLARFSALIPCLWYTDRNINDLLGCTHTHTQGVMRWTTLLQFNPVHIHL